MHSRFAWYVNFSPWTSGEHIRQTIPTYVTTITHTLLLLFRKNNWKNTKLALSCVKLRLGQLMKCTKQHVLMKLQWEGTHSIQSVYYIRMYGSFHRMLQDSGLLPEEPVKLFPDVQTKIHTQKSSPLSYNKTSTKRTSFKKLSSEKTATPSTSTHSSKQMLSRKASPDHEDHEVAYYAELFNNYNFKCIKHWCKQCLF